MFSVSPDDPLEELLGGGVGPALLVNRAQTQRRLLLVHLAGGPTFAVQRDASVDLAGGQMNQPFAAAHAKFHEGNQIGVVRVDHLERARVVQRRVAQCGQGDDDVAASGQVIEQPGRIETRLDALEPGRVAFQLVEAHVDRIDQEGGPRSGQEGRNQVRADESPGAQHGQTGVGFGCQRDDGDCDGGPWRPTSWRGEGSGAFDGLQDGYRLAFFFFLPVFLVKPAAPSPASSLDSALAVLSLPVAWPSSWVLSPSGAPAPETAPESEPEPAMKMSGQRSLPEW